MNRYTIFRKTGTHADVLAAIGAADLLRHLDPKVVCFEDRFEIQMCRELRRSDVEAADPGFSFLLKPNRPAPHLPPERIMRTQSEGADSGEAAFCVSSQENRMYAILKRLVAWGGPNRVIASFAGMKREQWEARIWEGLNGRADFVFRSPLVQLFNPHAARGYACLKPRGTNRDDATKDRWAEPFLEWLRYRGYFEGAAGWFATGNLRLFCAVPANIPYGQFVAAVGPFRNLRLGGTAAKIDCRAILGLTRLLIEKTEARRRPRQCVSEVAITNYKDMGQAHAVVAMEQLAIPDWFGMRTPRQEQLWLRTLEEHELVLRRLNDTHSDEFALLSQYRRTFQARRAESAREFALFLMSYGILLFRKRAQGHWLLPQLAPEGAIAILRHDPNIRRVLRNPGFVAVAAAVRRSTFNAQVARHNGRTQHREIRYGLLNDIRRAGSLGVSEFKGIVTSFIDNFNRENAKRKVKGLPGRHVSAAERRAFLQVLEQVPVAEIAAALCGVASCLRQSRAEVPVSAQSSDIGEQRREIAA